MVNNKRILICPLDWGLGHTTRCIAIINYLLESKHEVFIACNEWQQKIFEKEFTAIQFISLRGYNINYGLANNMAFTIALQIPKILRTIKKEHNLIEQISSENKIDVVISDNRYGCYSTKIPSVFITHQTKIKSPFFSGLINKINHHYINKYSQCWIPDFENHYLSRQLSTSSQLKNTSFIGPISRLQKSKVSIEKKYDFLFLLSGPEPLRTEFEETIVNQLKNTKNTFYIVRGLAQNQNNLNEINTSNYSNYCTSQELEILIQESEIVVCRSGYSSIMDLYALNAKAFFVPTPGQTEQEYLAEYFKQNHIANYNNQKEFTIENVLLNKKYNGFSQQSTLLNQKETILNLLAKLF